MVTGVYKITNLINSKFYIGSSSRNLLERFNKHQYQLKSNIHTNKHLQSSYNKYGIENFKFEILEYCSRDTCIEREQFYIDTLKPQYNKNLIAGSSLNVKHSEETKDKIRQKALGRKSKRKGTKCSEETIKKLKLKIRRHILYIYKDEILIYTFNSVNDASKILKMSRHTIYSMINEPLKRRKNKMKNFTFKIEEYGYS